MWEISPEITGCVAVRVDWDVRPKEDIFMEFCEPWIEGKLRERLAAYKARYPAFNSERVMLAVASWPEKQQRWAPYMKDSDIKKMNRTHHKLQSLRSLASNEHL